MMRIQGYPDPGDGLRLHLNENTGGCSPRVLEAIQRLQTTDVSTYPSYPERRARVRAALRRRSGLGAAHQRPRRRILMAAVGHIARARMHDAETIIPLPAFDPYPNSTAAVGATAVRMPPGPSFAFPTEAVIAAITPRTRMIFLNTPNNPTGQLIPIADLRRIAEAAPHAVVLIDEAYIEFGGTTFLPELPRVPERARRPHVLEGVRARRHARRRRHRPAAVARSGARRHAAVQHQRVALAATLARARGPRVPAALRRAGRGIARAAVRGLRAARSRVLGERGELRAGPRRRRGRAVRRGAGGAEDPRPRSLEGSDDARLHPHHGRDARAHRRGHRSARIGRWPARARRDEQRRRRVGEHSIARRPRRRSRARWRSTARAATTSAPASASSITCWSCSRGTAAST